MITNITGEPGAGKTSLMVCLNYEYLNRSAKCLDLLYTCRDAVKFYNKRGFNFTLPDKAPVYSSFAFAVPTGYKKYTGSYWTNAYRTAMTNSQFWVVNYLPYSRICICEAQRALNSRGSKKISPVVMRFYELHRHFDLEIFLDSQRPTAIDAGVRRLAGRHLHVMGNKLNYDKNGIATSITYTVYEFGSCSDAESWFDNRNNKNYDSIEMTFDCNPFRYFTSKCYSDLFLPDDNEQFHIREHLKSMDATDQVIYQEMYSDNPPSGFYE